MSKQQKHTPYYIYMSSSQKSELAIKEVFFILIAPDTLEHFPVSRKRSDGHTIFTDNLVIHLSCGHMEGDMVEQHIAAVVE